MASLKTNVFLNYINTITGLIFPVITFPYASRILLPDGIGVVNFQMSIINYIVLFTSLGIPLYAVKEIAKYRDNIAIRNKTTVEITILSLLLCLIGYIAVALIGKFVPQVNTNLALFYILSLTILFTAIGVNWFYQAIEDFKFITIRAVLIRTLAAASLFLFVKDKSDLLIYGAITVGSTVGNNVINFVHLKRYISISSLKGLKFNIFKHIRPALRIFVLNLIISIYVQLNTIMLGFMDGDYAVGIYTAGNKIPHIILSLVTSMGVVLLPRCSNLVASGKMDEFKSVCDKATRLVLMLALPFTAGLILLSEPIIEIFCGHAFIDAVPVIYWTAPVILFIGLTNVIGIQILYPLGKENIVIYSTLGGAIVNVALNIILIPKFSAIGAGISTFAAELAVLIIQIVAGRKYIPVRLFNKRNLKYLIATINLILIVTPLTLAIKNDWLQILISVISGATAYGLYLLYVNKLSICQPQIST